MTLFDKEEVTLNTLDVPLNGVIVPNKSLASPKCLIRYCPGC